MCQYTKACVDDLLWKLSVASKARGKIGKDCTKQVSSEQPVKFGAPA